MFIKRQQTSAVTEKKKLPTYRVLTRLSFLAETLMATKRNCSYVLLLLLCCCVQFSLQNKQEALLWEDCTTLTSGNWRFVCFVVICLIFKATMAWL